MATKTFFNTPWDQRSKLERTALIVGGSLALYIGYKTFKNFSSFVKTKLGQVQAGQELGSLQTQNINPNYTNTQYSIFAEALYSAMADSWFWYGTDEDAIKSIMQKMKNDADVLKLNTSFGTKDGYTLSMWFRSELETSDLDEYVNAPLRANGVTFQF